jgi:TetR/AcrR family transcriptional repressor of bet genes
MGRPKLREKRRAEITSAFSRVLAQRGYAGATIVAVAEEAGVAPGLIHHHFADKADLLASLLEDLVGRFRRRTAAKEPAANALGAYVSAALDLEQDADPVTARCWVGVLAEAVRDPGLGDRVRRLVDAEIETIRRRSQAKLSAHEASAVLALVLGSLVLGAFAPGRTTGFAGPAARALVRALEGRA